jgi:hypothetical protein
VSASLFWHCSREDGERASAHYYQVCGSPCLLFGFCLGYRNILSVGVWWYRSYWDNTLRKERVLFATKWSRKLNSYMVSPDMGKVVCNHQRNESPSSHSAFSENSQVKCNFLPSCRWCYGGGLWLFCLASLILPEMFVGYLFPDS